MMGNIQYNYTVVSVSPLEVSPTLPQLCFLNTVPVHEYFKVIVRVRVKVKALRLG